MIHQVVSILQDLATADLGCFAVMFCITLNLHHAVSGHIVHDRPLRGLASCFRIVTFQSPPTFHETAIPCSDFLGRDRPSVHP